jgi:hypothetical protein
MAICYTEPAPAGTGGKCNTIPPYTGNAWAQVIYTSPINGTTSPSYISTPNNSPSPCAFVGAGASCGIYNAPLPPNGSGYAWAKPGPGAIIGTTSLGANCSAGNTNVEKLLKITAAPCPSYTIADDTGVTYDTINPNNGKFQLHAIGTEGTGLLFRIIENVTGLDPNAADFEEKLLEQGALLAFVPLLGPFDTTGCPLEFAFTAQDRNNVWVFTDGAALGTPFTIACPPDQVYGPSDTVVYPPLLATNGGCGAITVTYNPPPSSLSCGTNLVTVTATDANGTTATCSFNAIRTLAFSGFSNPVNAVSPDNADCSFPVKYTVSSTKQTFPLKFTTLCGGVFFPGASPPVVKIYGPCPALVPPALGAAPVEQGVATKDTSNVWHFNIDLTVIPLGTYVADVQLQDGTHKRLVFKVGK